jgi:hypothetical protein
VAVGDGRELQRPLRHGVIALRSACVTSHARAL